MNDDDGSIDVRRLRELAKFGFASNRLRRLIWPAMLGLDRNTAYTPVITPTHRYVEQIDKDVNRSFNHFDVTALWSPRLRAQSRAQLKRILNSVLQRHQHDVHYIQGLHDIVSVIVIVCRNEALSYALTERLCLTLISDSVQPTLSTVIGLCQCVLSLVRCVDVELHDWLTEANVQSFITLSFILTWFSHNVADFTVVTRLFDYLISHGPFHPVYMTAALLIRHRHAIMALPCDMTEVHLYLQSLDANESAERRRRGESRNDDMIMMMCDLCEDMSERFPPKTVIAMAHVTVPTHSQLLRWTAADADTPNDKSAARNAVAALIRWINKDIAHASVGVAVIIVVVSVAAALAHNAYA